MSDVQKRKVTAASLQATKTVIWISIIAYCAFLVGRSTYQNYTMNREIAFYKKRVVEQKRVKAMQELALIYYKSNSFKELEARRRLNLKGKGEVVVALPKATTEPKLTVAQSSFSDQDALQITPLQAWWNLFFGKEQNN